MSDVNKAKNKKAHARKSPGLYFKSGGGLLSHTILFSFEL